MRSNLWAVILLALSSWPAANAAPAEGGPQSLLITYRSEPENRPAFRAWLLGEGRARFDALKKEGAFASYQILFNPFVTSGTWDALIVLEFARYTDTQRWREIERTSPGGLTAKALRLARPVDEYSADKEWSGTAESPGNSRDGVYYVIPYEYVAAPQYREYVDKYVLPQVQGWMGSGVLSGYRIFMNRAPVGPTWDALFIYQYRDLESFGRRDAVVANVRTTLVGDPVWKQLHEIKQTIRSETENTIAEELASSSPDREVSR